MLENRPDGDGMRILGLAMDVNRLSTAYNQFTVPLLDTHRVTCCTFRRAETVIDSRIDYTHGGASPWGFVTRLWCLLRDHEFDVVHIHAPRLVLLLTAVGLFASPRVLKRSVLHVHASYPLLGPVDRWLLLPAITLCGHVICSSHSTLRSLPRLYRLLARQPLRVICCGADLWNIDRFWIAHKAGMVDRISTLELVSVGELCKRGNHAAVIRALAHTNARDARLTIIGDGPEKNRLIALSNALGVADRVRFPGQLSREQTWRCLWEADGFVSMSRREGGPVAVLEAMSCFCPTLLSNIPAHREIRGTRPDLIPLFACDDYERLAVAIDGLACMPPDVLRAWGRDCRQHVAGHYALEQTREQFERVLRSFNAPDTAEWHVFCQTVQRKRRRRVA